MRGPDWKPLFLSLLLLASLGGLPGCGGDYEAERLLWKADRLLAIISKNPTEMPLGLFDKTRRMLEKVVREYPQSPKSAQALMLLGQLHVWEKKPDEAESSLRQVLEKFPENRELCAGALNAVGRLQEQNGRWEQALITYHDILARYGQTPAALPIPLYIAQRHARKKDFHQAKKSYQEAVDYYQSLEEKYPKSRAALSARELQFICFSETGRWQESLAVLQEIRDHYPGTPEAVRAVRARIGILRSLQHQNRNGPTAEY